MPGSESIRDELTQRVMAIVVRSARIAPERVAAESTFAELGLDSLDAVNIAFALEDEFHVAIPEETLRSVTGIGQAVEGILSLLSPGAGDSRPA